MNKLARNYLIITGLAACAGSVLHIAILFGGPDWYALFGAPRVLVEMARAGNLRAPVSCLIIASILAVLAAYAFSAAGVIRRLPLLRTGLALMAVVLILRGVVFIPMILWHPGSLSRICECRSVDSFIVLTSLLCLAMGIGYALGALAVAARKN